MDVLMSSSRGLHQHFIVNVSSLSSSRTIDKSYSSIFFFFNTEGNLVGYKNVNQLRGGSLS